MPRATSALNVIQRVGGTIGTALFVVVLQHQLSAGLGGKAGGGPVSTGDFPPAVRERVAGPLADAFAGTFWWAVGACVVALVPALMLARAERAVRRAGSATEPQAVPAAP